MAKNIEETIKNLNRFNFYFNIIIFFAYLIKQYNYTLLLAIINTIFIGTVLILKKNEKMLDIAISSRKMLRDFRKGVVLE